MWLMASMRDSTEPSETAAPEFWRGCGCRLNRSAHSGLGFTLRAAWSQGCMPSPPLPHEGSCPARPRKMAGLWEEEDALCFRLTCRGPTSRFPLGLSSGSEKGSPLASRWARVGLSCRTCVFLPLESLQCCFFG